MKARLLDARELIEAETAKSLLGQRWRYDKRITPHTLRYELERYGFKVHPQGLLVGMVKEQRLNLNPPERKRYLAKALDNGKGLIVYSHDFGDGQFKFQEMIPVSNMDYMMQTLSIFNLLESTLAEDVLSLDPQGGVKLDPRPKAARSIWTFQRRSPQG